MAQPILAAQDPQVATAIDQELERQRSCIELIASENFTSPAVMEAVSYTHLDVYKRQVWKADPLIGFLALRE